MVGQSPLADPLQRRIRAGAVHEDYRVKLLAGIKASTHRAHIQGPSLALNRVELAPHKPFGIESLDLETCQGDFRRAHVESLETERFMPCRAHTRRSSGRRKLVSVMRAFPFKYSALLQHHMSVKNGHKLQF